MESRKARILIIGATGYIGKRLVKASLALGHPTFLLYRPQIVSDTDKVQMIIDFKMQGATLLQGSFDDHESLVRALKQVDIVVSAAAAPAILEQLNLIDAIKQVGTIKRFLPSEFGMDPDRMMHAIPPGDELLKHKQVVRRAIEKAHIPHTYVSANCFAGIFLAGLAQLGHFMPPTDHVIIYGNGDKKCIWINEDDMARYTIMAVDDPRTLNKTLYLRPPGNILTQLEVVRIWENIMGKELKKTFVSEEDWLATLDKVDPFEQVAVTHLYQIFHRGDLDFKVEGPHGMDSNDLYPDYKYMTAEEYLKRFA
ncbi:bifunctional pinoresinol-lariciresinol reductase 2-like protein [Cinnamomum micranthum f. kanehirae]|uniref:Bifunctional pinoresinol-lariciresinol reductase 2-like protein n=1 Tax=Cinnamomum micranthum f. kanehirae TaxID=337451 RepID=A0A3S3NZD4_9MAGN|nr:bifunctional pinoresinol-lariciresinol reductase 2-like protein [Cinnamomum micranthum f. kanehirae]